MGYYFPTVVLSLALLLPAVSSASEVTLNWDNIRIKPIDWDVAPANFSGWESGAPLAKPISIGSAVAAAPGNISRDLAKIVSLPAALSKLARGTGLTGDSLAGAIARDIGVKSSLIFDLDGLDDGLDDSFRQSVVSYRPSDQDWYQFFGEVGFNQTLELDDYSAAQKSIFNDYFYSFGYSDWKNGTLELKYDNYAGNKFGDAAGFEDGTITAKYKFGLENDELGPLALDGSSRLSCYVGAKYTPRYNDDAGDRRKHKRAATTGCTAVLWNDWYAEFGSDFYMGGTQTDGDRDYFYAIGYANWRPGKINISYENYGPNRFPWNRKTTSNGSFWDGTIKISVNIKPFDERSYN